MTITVGAPGRLGEQEGRRVLAAFYGELLGMQLIDDQWMRIATDPSSALRIALDSDGWSDERPPRWNDPDHPQQMHFDIEVDDVESAGELVTRLGGTLLHEEIGGHRTYADPAGHPFCLYPGQVGRGARIARLVFDCFSPRSLASFYEALYGLPPDARAVDTPEHVVLPGGDDRFPDLAFQHAQFVACRWPDPAYPAQLHVDYRFTEGPAAAAARAEQAGAIRLPKLADTEILADPAGHPFCL